MKSNERSVVVVGIDRSAHAKAAVEYAAAHARRRHLALRLVHAYEPWLYALPGAAGTVNEATQALAASARELLDEATQVVRSGYPDLEVASRLEVGPAAPTLIDESATAECVVLGSRGSGGFTDLLVGSTTLHVASHARCPVIAVPAPEAAGAGAAPGASRSGVVVGVDGSELSSSAVEWAFRTADELGEPLIAIRAWTNPASLGPGIMLPLVFDADLVQREEEIVLAENLAGWAEKYPDVPVHSRVVRGHPVSVLVREANRARMLVVGSHGRGTVRSLLLGSVGHGVLHHAQVPVAIIRRTL